MERIKRLVSVFCTVLALAGLYPVQIHAVENTEEIVEEAVTDVTEETIKETTGEVTGEATEDDNTVTVNGETYKLTYRDVDFEVESPDRTGKTDPYGPVKATSIPSSYSSVTKGRVTSAKNQDPYGTCWAFSATAAAESSCYVRNGGSLYELSQMQLATFFYHKKVDPLGNATGDETIPFPAEGETFLDLGGNHAFTMWGLAGWTNGALNETLPYNSTYQEKAIKGQIADEYAYAYDVTHLQNAYIIPWDGTDSSKTNIKQAIMDYGMVACSYYHSSDYLNSKCYAYNCTKSSSNHAVAIVGWNDNYPKDNFKDKPQNDGAWLIRNSWGTNWGTDGDADPAMGTKAGYFWMSYEDASLLHNGKVFVYDFVPASKYQYNYQYDGSCGSHSTPIRAGDKVAAIYQVKGLTADAEKIDAVGIGIKSVDISGTVSVYVNPTDGKPTSGTLAAQTSFRTKDRGGYAGFYTIEIPDGVRVKKGDTYSVVVQFDNDCEVFADYSYKNSDWIQFVSNVQNDKTYYIANQSPDVTQGSTYTYRLKAYTNDAPMLGNARVERTAGDSANLTLTPTIGGTLYYKVSDTAVTGTSAFSDSVSVTANTQKTIPLTLNKDPDEATTVYYYLKDSSGTTSDILSLPIPAYAYPITINAPENGTLEVETPDGKIQSGDYVRPDTVCTVTATPNIGYAPDKLYVDGNAIHGSTFTVSGAHTVSATFVKLYQITVAEDSKDYLTLSKSAVVPGEAITITVSHNGENYLYADGEQIAKRTGSGTVNYTPTGDCTISLVSYQAAGNSDNLKWFLTDDGELILQGSGEMPSYDRTDKIPWKSYLGSIKQVTISSGITKIGKNAFANCTNLPYIVLPNSVKSVDNNAFTNSGVTDLFYIGNSLPFTPTLPYHLIATASDIATLSVGSCTNGTVTLDKTMSAAGETVTVTAAPNAGYEVTGYFVNGSPMTGNTYTLPNGGNYIFTVALKRIYDLNGDKAISSADLMILTRHVAGIQKITDDIKLKVADVNGDKVVNAADITALARMISAQ